MHNPDRVMGQFGLHQHIPDFVVPLNTFATQTPAERLETYHVYSTEWSYRLERVVQVRLEPQGESYGSWYRRVSMGPILRGNAPPVNYEPRGYIERELVMQI